MRSIFDFAMDSVMDRIKEILKQKKIKSIVKPHSKRMKLLVITKEGTITYSFEKGIKLKVYDYPSNLTSLTMDILTQINDEDVVNVCIERMIGRFMPKGETFKFLYWNSTSHNMTTYTGSYVTQKKTTRRFTIVFRVGSSPQMLLETYLRNASFNGKHIQATVRRITPKMLERMHRKVGEVMALHHLKKQKKQPATTRKLLLF